MKQISIRSAAAWLACLALSVTMTPMAAGAKEETVSASAAGNDPLCLSAIPRRFGSALGV